MTLHSSRWPQSHLPPGMSVVFVYQLRMQAAIMISLAMSLVGATRKMGEMLISFLLSLSSLTYGGMSKLSMHLMKD